MIEAAKSAAGLLSAGFAGFISGIYVVASVAAQNATPIPGAPRPEWIASVESVYFVAIVGLAASAGTWMYVDYRYEVDA